MSLVKSGFSWLRQSFAWSNSSAAWKERLIGLLFLGVAIGLIAFSAYRPVWESALAWSVYFIVIAVCSRQGWFRLFGPVLFYDMLVTARRSRYVIMRMFYAIMLLFILSFLFLNLNQNREDPTTVFISISAFFFLVLAQLGLTGLLTLLSSRVGRYIVIALLVLSMLLLVAGVIYLDLGDQNLNRDRNNVGRQSAQMAEIFFFVFMLVQMSMVVLLTPAYVAGAIAEEKDRKTLEFLLATDLNNREIILSKLLSRLANLTLFLLTGLPILSILQFIGGVDSELMIASFVGTGLAMLGIASLSMLSSTLYKRPRDAIGMTYLSLIAYMAIATTGFVMDASGRGRPDSFMELTIWPGEDAPTLGDVSKVVNTGNPIAAGIEITLAINERNVAMGRTTLAAELPKIVSRFAWFHVPLSLICIGWSILRVRAIALKQTVGGTTAKVRWWNRYRPPVGELPMLWKELHIEGGMKFNWMAFIVIVLLVLATLGSGLLVLASHVWNLVFGFGRGWHEFHENMNIWFRVAGTGVACLMVLHVAVRASTSLSAERERDTFDALITTPMSSESILAAKLFGSLGSLRMAWVWCGAMIALAIFTGGLHPLAVPLIVVAWIIYALLFAMIGIWYSMVCKTSLRATVYTVMTTIGVSVGHWLITGMCCFPLFAVMRVDHPGDFPEYLVKFQAGLTPPFVIGFLAYSWGNLADDFTHREFGQLMVFCLLGLFLTAMACLIMWFGILVPKFRQITRREELVYQ